MKVLKKPVVAPSEQELLYEALDCTEECCRGGCRVRIFDTDDTDDILF